MQMSAVMGDAVADVYVPHCSARGLHASLTHMRRNVDVGYVYCIAQPSRPEIVKIGRTKFSVRARLGSINTSVVEDYEIVWAVYCHNHSGVETLLHFYLRKRRIRQGREFFRLSRRAQAGLRLALERRVLCVPRSNWD
jgi:hypothetical protein